MKKLFLKIILIILSLIIVGTIVYFCLPSVALIQDSNFKLLYPHNGITKLAISLLKNKTRLKVYTIPTGYLTDENYILNVLNKCSNYSVVVMTSAVTASVKAHMIFASEKIKGLAVGIAASYSAFFDTILVSDSAGAFEYAEENNLNAVFYLDSLTTKDKYNAIVYPDFQVSILPLLKIKKGTMSLGFLLYDCLIL